MIEIATLNDGDKGRSVRYETFGRIEYGRITSWNERFIFVRYHTVVEGGFSRSRTGETSEATEPRDLEFCS